LNSNDIEEGALLFSKDTSISALLPVRNGSAYLENLLPNILNMLEVGDELVVVDDGSTDSTEAILAQWRTRDSRIKYEKTIGVGLISALNLGLQKAGGAWIARFDVDDLYTSSRLREQRQMMEKDVSVIFSDYNFISTNGIGLGRVHSAIFPLATVASLISSQRTAHPSALINRKLLIGAGGYRSNDFPAEDLALWLRLLEVGKLVSVPKVLIEYRLSVNSISARNRITQTLKKDEVISSFTKWDDIYFESHRHIQDTLLKYCKIEGGNFRILLHLRDLRLIEIKLGLPKKRLNLFKVIGIRKTAEVCFAALVLILETTLRRTYRLFWRFAS
jgi:glycosyltransferase involved in cell wall biosynthesis